MNTHHIAFSIAVALPNYLKSLVERMLQSILRDQTDERCRWYLSNAPDADVTLRLLGDGSQVVSPSLLAEVRRRDGRIETLNIDGPWRTGAMAAAFAQIGELLQARAPRDRSGVALEWLQRWNTLRSAGGTALIALRAGGRLLALLDTRHHTLQAMPGETLGTPEAIIDTMTHEGWTLEPAPGTASLGPGVSLKPLLWRLGLYAGVIGALPALQGMSGLRLKGWPYLAAGGHKSFADLIQALRGAGTTRAALQGLALAPRSVVDGFLNACLVCEFFHDAAPAGAAAVAPLPQAADQRHVISAIRRSLAMRSS